jgi:predicted nucleotidyltransferase
MTTPLTKSLSMALAEEVALLLLLTCHVEEVYLFGSVARGRIGNDIDVIATVSEQMFHDYLDWIERLTEEETTTTGDAEIYSLAAIRYSAAEQVLDWDDAELRRCTRGVPCDIFLLPADWLNRKAEMQDMFAHRDPMFTNNIARDARRFNVVTGTFDEAATE